MDKTARFVIADPDPVFCRELGTAIKALGGTVAAVTDDGRRALELVYELRPRVLLTDIPLFGLDGLSLVKPASSAGTLCIVASAFAGPSTKLAAVRLGAAYFAAKPCDAEALVQVASAMVGTAPEEHDFAGHILTARILEELGISGSLHGFDCLCGAMELAGRDSGALRAVTKELYPELASRLNTSPVCVERRIRFAVSSAWENGGSALFSRVLGPVFDSRPTNSQFLSALYIELDRRLSGMSARREL